MFTKSVCSTTSLTVCRNLVICHCCTFIAYTFERCVSSHHQCNKYAGIFPMKHHFLLNHHVPHSGSMFNWYIKQHSLITCYSNLSACLCAYCVITNDWFWSKYTKTIRSVSVACWYPAGSQWWADNCFKKYKGKETLMNYLIVLRR